MSKFSYKLGDHEQNKPNFTSPNSFLSRFLSFKKSRSVFGLVALTLLLAVSANAAFSSDGRSFFGIFDYSANTLTTNTSGVTVKNSKPYDFLNLFNWKTKSAAATFAPAFAAGTNLDQLHNGAGSKGAEWANGNINAQNSCYAEGDVVPYRYFVSGLGPVGEHTFTINFEFTKAGKKAFDYLTEFDASENLVLAGLLNGACSNTSTTAPGNCTTPVPVGPLPNPMTYFSTVGGYGGEPLVGPQMLYAYNVSKVSFGVPMLIGSVAGTSEIKIEVKFTPTTTGDVGFFWGGHLAMGTPTTWGIGNGSGSVSGAPFHMRATDFDGGGGANQDRSIQNGSVCLPPQAAITTDAETYCPGSENHTATAPEGAASYNWTIAGGTITSGQGTGSITFKVDPFLPASGQTGCMGKVVLGVSACASSGACPGDSCCSKATKEINVIDNTAPMISGVGGDIAIECSQSPVFSSPTATDSCDPSVSLTFADTTAAGTTCAGNYTVTRTWTATDKCGNSSTASQKLTVKDTIGPVFEKLPDPTTIECSVVANFAQAKATDACGSVTLSFEDKTTGTCPKVMTRTWTAKDDCGNTSTASQTININDTIAPVLSDKPADAAYQCLADVPAAPVITAMDNCSINVAVTFSETGSNGTSCSNVISRTWSAKDDCNNLVSWTQKITVNDTTAPVLSDKPADAAYQCFADVPAAPTITATDNCAGPVLVSFSETGSNGTSCDNVITRIWSAKDACNNPVVYSQKITVKDTIAPVLSAKPTDLTVQCLADVPVAPTITATDNCAGTIPVTLKEINNGTSCNNVITRTWTTQDACGNSDTYTQTITVNDTTAPTLSDKPADATYQCLADVPAAPAITANDRCAGVLPVDYKQTESNPGSSCDNVITRTWSAKDACNNPVEYSQKITVKDTSAPTLSASPADASYQCLSDVPAVPTITATDNCATSVAVNFSESPNNGTSCNNVFTRTWTAKDACGNEAKWIQTITVNDTTAPVLSAKPVDAAYQCLADVPAAPVITALDNCSGLVGVIFSETGSNGTSCNNVITRTWSAKDACNNPVSWSQKITVNDTTPPAITDFQAAGVEACFGAPVTIPILTALDNCTGPVPVMYVRSDGKLLTDPYPLGVTIVSAVAKDACGNASAERKYNVTVKDCAQAFCSLTQGGWGNSNGKFNGEVRIDTIKRLITAASPLIIGSNGRTIAFVDGAEQCLIDKMPAGGTAAVLPAGLGDVQCGSIPASLLKNGRLNSVIWGQTVALSLNVRLDPNLGGKALCRTMITAKALPGPDGKVGTSDDIPEAPGADLNLDGVPDNYLKVTIPNSVFTALGGNPATVNNILALANRALGGQPTGGASLGDINTALDAINQGFDECRFLMSCTN